jgi:hypothetical protein
MILNRCYALDFVKSNGIRVLGVSQRDIVDLKVQPLLMILTLLFFKCQSKARKLFHGNHHAFLLNGSGKGRFGMEAPFVSQLSPAHWRLNLHPALHSRATRPGNLTNLSRRSRKSTVMFDCPVVSSIHLTLTSAEKKRSEWMPILRSAKQTFTVVPRVHARLRNWKNRFKATRPLSLGCVFHTL